MSAILPPATRSLEVVLRDALAAGDEVRLIVAKALADTGQNASGYINVEIEGVSLTIPKLQGAGLSGLSVGAPVYVLAARDFLLAIGSVKTTGGAGTGCPVGAIFQWPTAVAPVGFLFCNGGSFVAATYPALAVILGGTTLPDLRRRVPVGAGSGAFTPGASDGLAEGSRGIAHHHRIDAPTSFTGAHQHPTAGAHFHAPSNGLQFATSSGQTMFVPTSGTQVNRVAAPVDFTSTTGDHQHGSAGDHQHELHVDTSGGGAQDAPSYIVLNFVICAQ